MTSRERMKSLFIGKRPDRVPVIPMAMSFTAKAMGVPLLEFYTNMRLCFDTQVEAAKKFGYDGNPTYGMACFGGYEFGGEIEFPVNERIMSPTVRRHPIETPQDVDRIAMPDPRTAGIMPLLYEFGHICVEHGISANFVCGSPFSMAANCVYAETFMLWLIDCPEVVHTLMRKTSDFCLALSEAFIQEFGARAAAGFFSTFDANSLISPDQFREFAFPYAREVNQKVLDMGVRSMFVHLCGNHMRNLPMWAEVPFGNPGVISLGDENDLTYAKEVLGKQHIIAGNINTAVLMQETPEKVEEACRRALEKAKDAPRGYVVMPSCELPPATPIENLEAMLHAARTYGRYGGER
ncbi:MAG: uroporphyrinogen decarboxylase family protein [Candidatus Tectomicrobia bacterium]|nr:uroporphyrinogen decarboxylase family protein [Candidatus Tectomicrobia bacterium]